MNRLIDWLTEIRIDKFIYPAFWKLGYQLLLLKCVKIDSFIDGLDGRIDRWGCDVWNVAHLKQKDGEQINISE